MEITFGERSDKTLVPYSISDGKWIFQDILEFPSDSVPSDQDIRDTVTARFVEWRNYVETPAN